MPRGYMEGPVAEEAEARLEALRRGEPEDTQVERLAVYGSTDAEPAPHFIGWLGDVDPDALFASGQAWGISVRRRVA
jgi:hypothetical protein